MPIKELQVASVCLRIIDTWTTPTAICLWIASSLKDLHILFCRICTDQMSPRLFFVHPERVLPRHVIPPYMPRPTVSVFSLTHGSLFWPRGASCKPGFLGIFESFDSSHPKSSLMMIKIQKRTSCNDSGADSVVPFRLPIFIKNC